MAISDYWNEFQKYSDSETARVKSGVTPVLSDNTATFNNPILGEYSYKPDDIPPNYTSPSAVGSAAIIGIDKMVNPEYGYYDVNGQGPTSENIPPPALFDRSGALYTEPASNQQVATSQPNQPTETVSPNQKVVVPPSQLIQQQNKTGIVVDPGIETVRMQVNNRMSGVGDQATGNIEAPPEMPVVKTLTQQLEDTGKRISMDQNKIPKWNESDSFNYGLINFGLNLLSGNDLATSLNAASNKFSQMYGEEKRTIWAEDLRRQGFDETEIQQYIKTGNSKDLTDPMEKKSKILQYNLQTAQLDKSLYENSPEMRKYAANVESWKNKMEVAKYQDDKAYKQAQFGLEQARLALSRQELADKRAEREAKKAEATGKFNLGYDKARNQFTRAKQELTNYQKTLQEVGPMTKTGVVGDVYDAATIEAVFSGNQIKETLARKLNPATAHLVTAERGFLAPLLRKDSGAAISHGEWKTTGEIYFPRPGDSPEKVRRKENSRAVALLAMDPDASSDLKSVVDAYTNGQISEIRYNQGRVSFYDGKGWRSVQ